MMEMEKKLQELLTGITSVIKEQQETIEKQQAQIDQMRAEIRALSLKA